MKVAGVKITNPAWIAIGNPKPGDDEKRRMRAVNRINRAIKWAQAEAAKGPGIFSPIRTTNPLNNRKGYRKVSKSSKTARYQAQTAMIFAKFPKRFPVRVTMIRYYSGRKLDKNCGLNAALKPVRDGIADYMGCDDGDEQAYEWKYDQWPAPQGCHGVRIILEYQGYAND